MGGMGHIDSDKANPVYVVGAYCKTPGWNYHNFGLDGKGVVLWSIICTQCIFK